MAYIFLILPNYISIATTKVHLTHISHLRRRCWLTTRLIILNSSCWKTN